MPLPLILWNWNWKDLRRLSKIADSWKVWGGVEILLLQPVKTTIIPGLGFRRGITTLNSPPVCNKNFFFRTSYCISNFWEIIFSINKPEKNHSFHKISLYSSHINKNIRETYHFIQLFLLTGAKELYRCSRMKSTPVSLMTLTISRIHSLNKNKNSQNITENVKFLLLIKWA